MAELTDGDGGLRASVVVVVVNAACQAGSHKIRRTIDNVMLQLIPAVTLLERNCSRAARARIAVVVVCQKAIFLEWIGEGFCKIPSINVAAGAVEILVKDDAVAISVGKHGSRSVVVVVVISAGFTVFSSNSDSHH